MAAKKKDVSNQRAENQRLNKSNPSNKSARRVSKGTGRVAREAANTKARIAKYSENRGSVSWRPSIYDASGPVTDPYFEPDGSPAFKGRVDAAYNQHRRKPEELGSMQVRRVRVDGNKRNPQTGAAYGYHVTPAESAAMMAAYGIAYNRQKALGPSGKYFPASPPAPRAAQKPATTSGQKNKGRRGVR